MYAPPASRPPLWALGLFAALFCALSVRFGADASWDLRNYHLYDPYALLSGTLWRDIAPAQLQSFYAPTLDVAQFALRRALNAHPSVLAIVLALPHALAAWLALGIALRVGLPLGVAVVAILLGATGTAGLPTLGTAMSEAVPACLVLAALGRVGDRPFGAGLFAGVAIGLKLTFAVFAPGLAAALLAIGRWRSLPVLLAGFAAGALAVAGPWCWELWQHTGNPLFPYFNNVFRSAWAPAEAMTDTRFLPRDALHALMFPLYWTVRPSQLVSELPVRDPRLALAWVGWLVVLARAAWRREAPASPVRALLAFWVAAFAAWEARFSILRYAATLEVLAGIPMALALMPSPRARLLPHREEALSRLILLAGLVAWVTIYPDWGRTKPGPLAAEVRPPAFPEGSLVLLLDPAPMAYVAVFSPPGVRFADVNSNLLRPGGTTVIGRAATAAIDGHDGPLWGLESPEDQPGQADLALAAYGLARGNCARVQSNLDADAIRACVLIRVQRPPPARITSRSSTPSPTLIAMPASASSTSAANMRGISSR